MQFLENKMKQEKEKAVFEENGISFDMIAGTSMGSVIGALYAIDQDVDKIQKTLKNYLGCYLLL